MKIFSIMKVIGAKINYLAQRTLTKLNSLFQFVFIKSFSVSSSFISLVNTTCTNMFYTLGSWSRKTIFNSMYWWFTECKWYCCICFITRKYVKKPSINNNWHFNWQSNNAVKIFWCCLASYSIQFELFPKVIIICIE